MSALGYTPGPVDGKWGSRAGRAYSAFLRDAGQPVTDRLTPDGLRALRKMASARGKAIGPAAPPKRPKPRDLFRTVRNGDIDGTRLVLRSGADPNLRDERGWTPLMHAVNKGYRLLVPFLLGARADADLQAADGAPALFMAVLQGMRKSQRCS